MSSNHQTRLLYPLMPFNTYGAITANGSLYTLNIFINTCFKTKASNVDKV